MIRFCSLVSGSSGNAAYLEYKSTRLLIDCGVSCKRVCAGLAEMDVEPQAVTAMLVTHEHIDHVAGIAVYSKRFSTPVYATEGSWGEMNRKNTAPAFLQKSLEPGRAFEIGHIGVEPFSIPHDAAGPVGYVFHAGNRKIAVATDMGKIDASIAMLLRGSDFVMLESNHDTQMLINGPYPYPLKQRVIGGAGHLSNDQAAKLAAALARVGTNRFLLGHLSATNNSPALALETVTAHLREQGCDVGQDVHLEVANRHCRSAVYEI